MGGVAAKERLAREKLKCTMVRLRGANIGDIWAQSRVVAIADESLKKYKNANKSKCQTFGRTDDGLD